MSRAAVLVIDKQNRRSWFRAIWKNVRGHKRGHRRPKGGSPRHRLCHAGTRWGLGGYL